MAHARPQFDVTESEARAGEPVHFSVSGADGKFGYDLEVGGREVVKGAAVGNPILGQFTMPDLGNDARVVKVEAHVELLGKVTNVKQKIRYAGPAGATAAPGGAPPAVAAPAAAPQTGAPAAVTPAPPPAVQVPPAGAAPPPHEGVATHIAGQRPRKAGGRRTSRPEPARAVERRRRIASVVQRSKPKRRSHPRTAPLFDGVPESPGGPASATGGDGFNALNAILSRTGAALSPPAGEGDSGLSAAVAVPGLLALGALMVAGTAVARRRRIAAR